MKIKFDIKPLIKESGTQREFAELTGINLSVVGHLCRGVSAIHLKTVAKIMEATGKEPNDLFIIVDEQTIN